MQTGTDLWVGNSIPFQYIIAKPEFLDGNHQIPIGRGISKQRFFNPLFLYPFG
jgi:hypothetical protein